MSEVWPPYNPPHPPNSEVGSQSEGTPLAITLHLRWGLLCPLQGALSDRRVLLPSIRPKWRVVPHFEICSGFLRYHLDGVADHIGRAALAFGSARHHFSAFSGGACKPRAPLQIAFLSWHSRSPSCTDSTHPRQRAIKARQRHRSCRLPPKTENHAISWMQSPQVQCFALSI